MRKNILIVFLFGSFNLFSQNSPVLFLDEFDNNNNDWPIRKDGYTYTAEISNGKYNIKTKKDAKSFQRTLPISSVKDYTYEVPFRIEGRFGYIELFSYTVDVEELCFVLYGSNVYSIYIYKDKKYTYLADSKDASKCFPTKYSYQKTAIMKIEQMGTKTFFSINGIVLETIENLHIPGNKLGFYVGDSTKVSIDKFTIMQNNNGINLTKTSNQEIKRERLGPTVNSTGPELGPIVTSTLR